MAEHFIVKSSSGVATGCWSSWERKDCSWTPFAIWCLTNAYGLSVDSASEPPHSRAILLNPVPGNQSGRYFTWNNVSYFEINIRWNEDFLQDGIISTIHAPGTPAFANWSIARPASSTRGSGLCGSVLYPYAILRITDPASLSRVIY